MGRMVKKYLYDWQGCADHRLEKTAGAFNKHKDVLACAAKAKVIVTLIHTSSQVLMPVNYDGRTKLCYWLVSHPHGGEHS